MGSANYDRIRRQVIDVVARIPHGHVTTYADIGEELEVVPRHVAYLLTTTLDEAEERLPWHRVVGVHGVTARGRRGSVQRDRLRAEGVPIVGQRVDGFDQRRVRVPLDAAHRTDPATPLSRRPRDG